ncbi:hypothetical protein H5410_064377 [Solanum commersonii]|uniref:Uncharacterized protein n=1 Tax=Solanum commersonii TaxID=4109 RepID=A0A9J5VZK8_SOLCO|nr:hypothetical protein H5410_064377 [Solanum commersonii]
MWYQSEGLSLMEWPTKDTSSTTNVWLDGGKKHRKGSKNLKSTTPSKALTSHPPSTTEASDDDCGEEPIDVTPGKE